MHILLCCIIDPVWGGESIDYSSSSDVYSDNISESESENCSDYDSDYESDNKTNTIETPVPQPPKVEEQLSNTTYSTEQVSPTYSKRQEKFEDKFTQKDLLNKICRIASLPARDISSNKDSLEDVHLWDYLLLNYGVKEGISLLDAYTQEELTNKLVIQVEQALYRILDCSWEEIFKGLVIMTSSNPDKCSYHLLYAPALLIDYQELKQFTELHQKTFWGVNLQKFTGPTEIYA
ncbi:hypothetical protein Glove_131g51 [Diversispora epigaea]|uniref:Uncharacterized protein n=1 Tax=Diversispora epigaea TaxID=1348612 RepID=A0A397J7X5_9GLOM|nr:hypothetical protein Glove_131g51 [Diversispora epigaea]